MKKWILALFLCALPCAAQISYAPPGPVQPPAVPGDLLCAVAGDTSIGTATVIGASATGTGPYSVTYTMSATPAWYQVIGQKIGVTGATPSAFNVASAAVTAYTSTTVTVSMASNPGTWTSGGTTFLACGNGANDTSATPFQNVYPIPAGFWSASSNLRVNMPVMIWTSASPPQIAFTVDIGSTDICSASNFITQGGSSGKASGVSFSVAGLSSDHVAINPISLTAFNLVSVAGCNLSVSAVSTSAQNLKLAVWYTAATAGNAILLPRMVVGY